MQPGVRLDLGRVHYDTGRTLLDRREAGPYTGIRLRRHQRDDHQQA